jgi:hypothetical protein
MEVSGSSEEVETCFKNGKILHSASVNKPSDTIHNEICCWTDKEIHRMSCNVHFSVVETQGGLAAIRFWNADFLLVKGRTGRVG